MGKKEESFSSRARSKKMSVSKSLSDQINEFSVDLKEVTGCLDEDIDLFTSVILDLDGLQDLSSLEGI